MQTSKKIESDEVENEHAPKETETDSMFIAQNTELIQDTNNNELLDEIDHLKSKNETSNFDLNTFPEKKIPTDWFQYFF